MTNGTTNTHNNNDSGLLCNELLHKLIEVESKIDAIIGMRCRAQILVEVPEDSAIPPFYLRWVRGSGGFGFAWSMTVRGRDEPLEQSGVERMILMTRYIPDLLEEIKRRSVDKIQRGREAIAFLDSFAPSPGPPHVAPQARTQ